MKKLLLFTIFFTTISSAKELTLADVRTLFPFGKTDTHIEKTLKDLKNNKISVNEAINQKFEQNDHDILAKFQATFPSLNIDLNEVYEFRQQNYSQNPLFTTVPIVIDDPKDHPLIKRAREIIASFGMNPIYVNIGTSNKDEDENLNILDIITKKK